MAIAADLIDVAKEHAKSMWTRKPAASRTSCKHVYVTAINYEIFCMDVHTNFYKCLDTHEYTLRIVEVSSVPS